MGAIRPVSGSRWATPDRISRTITVRAAVSGGIAAAAGLAATFHLMPAVAWGLCVLSAATLFSLALGYPLRTLQKTPGALVSVATGALVVAAAVTAGTGGMRSINLVIDLTVFSVSATLYPPPWPMFVAVANCAVIALPGYWAGHGLGDWRLILAMLGSSLAAAYYSPVAHHAVVAGLRNQRRLQAAAAIGRALTALDVGRILTEVAAETGKLLDAGSVTVTAIRADEPQECACWTTERDTPALPQTELENACARAIAQGSAVVCSASGAWTAAPADGVLAPDTVGLAMPYGPGHEPAGVIAVGCSVQVHLPTWALDAVRDVADSAALGVRAAVLHAESKRQALMDPITHLYNARYLSLRLEEEVARARRRRDPLSLLFLDSDSLKLTNDRYGHQYGDRLVRALAQMISENVRAEDVPVRYAGGDEFIVILPNTDWPEAGEIADRLRRAARRLPVGPRGEPLSTVSIGVATYPIHAMDADELVARADQAMYAAKSAGKDCVAIFSHGVQAQSPGEPFVAP